MIEQNNRTFTAQEADFKSAEGRANFGSEFWPSFEAGVIAFGAGIAVYFVLPAEPDWRLLALMLGALGLICLKLQPRGGHVFILWLLLAGLGRAAWHTDNAFTPRMPDYERSYMVTGWIKDIEASGSRHRWLIRVDNIDRLETSQTPHLIRTAISNTDIKAGDGVRLRVTLSAPPGPVVPGGYDPARRAYFRRIGGYGFAVSRPQSADVDTSNFQDRFDRFVSKMRHGFADRIRAAAPADTAGLQAALLTGIRTYIPEKQTDALRTAGLAHVLAISGLHMGLMTGSIYFVVTLMLAFILPLSRRMDVRKPAAMIGAIAATAYLILSGASVATQRAWIMALIVFLAIILDRRAFSMRSVALAALLTLLWHPEALISAGFQMSFSAVAALVVVYRTWDRHRTYTGRAGPITRFRNGFVTLSVTSFVAGMATAVFAAMHFNRVATYNLLGNLLAMPFFTFWVMPSGFLVFLALPFSLERYPLWVMSKGLEILLAVSHWTADLKGALTYIPAPPGWLIGVYGLAFIGLCLGQKRMRFASVFVIVGLCVVWLSAPKPDMRISDKGDVAIWYAGQDPAAEDGLGNILYVGRHRADRYGREQFMRHAGRAESRTKSYRDSVANCDVLACRIEINGHTISIVAHPSEVLDACDTSDLVVLTKRNAGPVATRGCAAILVDSRTLNANGAQDVYITPDNIRLSPALTPARKKRPWG